MPLAVSSSVDGIVAGRHSRHPIAAPQVLDSIGDNNDRRTRDVQCEILGRNLGVSEHNIETQEQRDKCAV